MRKHLFTSESVTEGHPDKVADQISDAVLDAIYQEDPDARVACEALVTTGLAVVAGEITTDTYVEIPKVVRQTIHNIGYDEPEHGFASKTCGVVTAIQSQSPDIAMGVDKGGAGDQGMMLGYATSETPELMPLPIILAHRLARRLAEVRKQRLVKYLRPDGKTQVTIEYHDGKIGRVEAVVVSAHHAPGIPLSDIRADMQEYVIRPVIPKRWLDRRTKIFVNPTGRFEVGGPMADTGLTGRKIVLDTYGGIVGHGGGAFSGKDPTKVDRSAAYMTRYVAKNLVAAGAAEKCEIQLAYAIGIAEPVSIMVNTFGTGRLSETALVKIVRDLFDLTPRGIIKTLRLRRPIYLKTAAYGHFGREGEGFTWEETDRVKDIQRAAKRHIGAQPHSRWDGGNGRRLPAGLPRLAPPAA
jgi:S-adenosylmethionine synthetase